VLLYGPPGTGKTMIAKALAKESNACFINVRAASLQSKWFGDAQKLVTAVFTLAWKIQPCIIFIDEIDSFLGTRKSSEHEAVTSMKTEFMALWDGFLTDAQARVLVLAATNRPWDIDEAILRRLPRAYEVPLPDAAQRRRILSVLLRGEDVDGSVWAPGALEALAAQTGGYSGSDLQDLCKQAALLPIRDLLQAERAAEEAGLEPPPAPRPLRAADLLEVLRSAPPPSAEAAAAYQRSVAQGRGRGGRAGGGRRQTWRRCWRSCWVRWARARRRRSQRHRQRRRQRRGRRQTRRGRAGPRCRRGRASASDWCYTRKNVRL